MHTKKDAAFIVNVVLSMLILAYITFITVYEQILTQNNGFFNVIVYGVVLILVFIFITLFVRVLTIKRQTEESSPVLKVLIIFGVLAVFAVFTIMRLRYTSSISPTESPLYKTALYITENQLDQASDVHDHINSYPGDFVYAYLISGIFSITEADSVVYIIINITMMLIVAAFLFFTVNLLAGKACATMAIILFLFMPNNAYLVYSYNSELFVAAMFMITLFIYEVFIYRRFKNPGNARALAIICGVFGGLALSCEPVLLIALIVLMAWVISAKRQAISCAIMPVIIAFVETIILLFLKTMMMAGSFLEVIKNYFLCFVPIHIREVGAEPFSIGVWFGEVTSRFNNPSKFLNDNSYFLTNVDGGIIGPDQVLWLSIVDQFIYLFVLILCVLCVVYILRVTYDKVLPSLAVMIALFFGQLLGGSNRVNYIYFVVVIILIGSTTAYYMYLNHHPIFAVEITNEQIRKDNELMSEEPDEDSDEEELPSEYMLRARALVFLGEDDELYNVIKTEERLGRENNSIAATMIKTHINDEGEYDSVEEHIEYLDDPDEAVEVKEVHEVKAIPSTRPVEIVKPILADDYAVEENEVYSNESDLAASVVSTEDSISMAKISGSMNMNSSMGVSDSVVMAKPILSDEGTTPAEESAAKPQVAQPEGFVFRKKESTGTSTQATKALKEKPVKEKAIKEKPVKQKTAKESLEEYNQSRQQKKSLFGRKTHEQIKPEINKDQVSLDSVKPGEPLPNPLKGPAPSSKTKVGFDFDGDDGDDFDF